MQCLACDTGALGLSFLSSPQANYNVDAAGRSINAAELFTEEFRKARTEAGVKSVMTYLNDGSGKVHDDGSITVMRGTSAFRIAPTGSVIVAKYRQLYPNAASVAVAMGIPLTGASPAVKSTVAASTMSTPQPSLAQALNAGTPAPTSATAPAPKPTIDLAGTIGSVINVGLDLYRSSQDVKVAQAQAKAAQAAAAVANPVFNPPTGTAQGAAVNTSAAYGYGFNTQGGARYNPPESTLSLPAIPGLPLAPMSTPLPGTGLVMQPSTMQGVSPTTGLATPFFPGLPATSETADGSKNLNAASLTRLMAATAAQAEPLPPPSSGFPWKLAAGVAVAGLAIYLVANRRRRR